MKKVIAFREGRELIYQTDAGFASIANMRPKGCYFLSIVEALTCHFDIPFDYESVTRFYLEQLLDREDDVDNEMFVADPQNIFDDLVGKGKVWFRGVRGPLYECEDNEFEWLCWHKAGTAFNHFTHGNGRGIVIYDPWGVAGSSSVRDGKLIGKRIALLV